MSLRIDRSATLLVLVLITCSLGTLISFSGIFGIAYGPFKIIRASQFYGFLHLDENLSNHPLNVGGSNYNQGIATHTESYIELKFPDKYHRFSGLVGIDRSAGNNGSVIFEILSDNTFLWRSPVIKGAMQAVRFNVVVDNMSKIVLHAYSGSENNDNFNHADWLELALE